MKNVAFSASLFLFFCATAAAQSQDNSAVSQQIKMLRADGGISLSYDAGSNVSKLMAVSENFDDSDARRAGLQAMNFAAGFLYAGQAIKKSPDTMIVTFWVLTKKPRFAQRHDLTIYAGGEVLNIGESRYSARARENIEYLNFNISREALSKVAKQTNVRFTLGEAEFVFTKGQLRMLANLLLLCDTAR